VAAGAVAAGAVAGSVSAGGSGRVVVLSGALNGMLSKPPRHVSRIVVRVRPVKNTASARNDNRMPGRFIRHLRGTHMSIT
jgi:hypothetical protein